MTYEEAFELAMTHVAEFEGIYSDDAADRGGPTKYGVCLEFLKGLGTVGDINKDGVINKKDVLAVTKDKAKELFKKNFWTNPKAERFPPVVAMMYFDSAVNCGCKQTNKLLQRAAYTDDDGIVGPKTVTAVNAMNEADLIKRFAQKRRDFYNTLVARRPSQKVFIKGWLRRVNACEKLCLKYC